MVDKTPISDDYLLAVADFCLSHKALMDACDNGDYEGIPELAADLEEKKETLLAEKEKQGFTDGLSFIEDNTYIGFKVINGRFIGDDVAAYQYGCECATNFRKGVYPNVFYELALYLLYNIDIEAARRSLKGNSGRQGRQRAA